MDLPFRGAAPPTRLISAVLLVGLAALATRPALGQGVTTASVRGTVQFRDGRHAEGARVAIRNVANGFVTEVVASGGRFLVGGLEIGGPYRLTVRAIGARPVELALGTLTLGEPRRLDVVLEPTPVALDSIVVWTGGIPRSTADGGTVTTISDSALSRLPSLNRDQYDFVRLVPQVSTRVGLGSGGISGGGVSFRLNNFLTNGVPERSLAGGQPPEFAGGKALPLDAVAEYQVLLAPFDVRYGDFAGAAINTVTRSGTNAFHGSLLGQSRSDVLSRGAGAGLLPYQRDVAGFSLSGPLRRDRAHFFVAAEFKHQTAPMPGPYIGQPADVAQPVPVRAGDLTRLGQVLGGYQLEAGSGGPVANRSPLRNLFARVDVALSPAHRALAWVSDADFRTLAFARSASDTTFPLTSTATTGAFAIRTLAVQLHSTLRRAGGGHNELFVSGRTISSRQLPAVRQPQVTVLVPGAFGGGVIAVQTGTPAQAQASRLRARNLDLRDNLTLPLGPDHVATAGIEAEAFDLRGGGLPNSYGSWSFLSIDSLALGLADRYDVARDYGAAELPLTGHQLAAYLGDRWRLGDRVSITVGLRADWLSLTSHAPYNPTVDSIFGRRTDVTASGSAQLSPRLGVTWVPGKEGHDQFRGGIGIFTGRPPLAWFQTPLRSYGTGVGVLRCGIGGGALGPPPSFDPDRTSPPTACSGGAGTTPAGDVELIAPGLRPARTLRTVLAWDRALPGGTLLTVEALLTWNRSDFQFVNLNLSGPVGEDPHGRVLYGTIDQLGRAIPALRATSLPAVIDLQNVSANQSTQLSARVVREFSRAVGVTLAYTWSRVRDVQTPLRVNTRGLTNWSSRAVSERHDDPTPETSLNDVPHRIVLAGVVRTPSSRWPTEISVLYVGESGSPFTYLAWGQGRLGDLNADGSNANDPIYVPRDAFDPGEIAWSGMSADPTADQSAAAQAGRILAQQEAFEGIIASTACLRRQRGQILRRNSCREAWTHTSVVSIRQRIPLAGRGIELQMDLFNLLNLIRSEWGVRRLAAPALLEQVGQVGTANGGSQPVFRLQPSAAQGTVVPAESAYQFQFGLGYRF